MGVFVHVRWPSVDYSMNIYFMMVKDSRQLEAKSERFGDTVYDFHYRATDFK